MIREGLRGLLEREPDLLVLGEASSLAGALAVDIEPDVIVADLMLPDARGAEVIERLVARFPGSPVLVLTMVDSPADVRLAFAAGARGYLLKEAASAELVQAVRRVAAGEDYLQPAMGAAMAASRRTPPRAHAATAEALSGREREVLRLVALGHTNAEIAQMLFVSVRTVESHRASLQRKVGVRSRAELVRFAREHTLLEG
jgi:two-component system response regulator NreC